MASKQYSISSVSKIQSGVWSDSCSSALTTSFLVGALEKWHRRGPTEQINLHVYEKQAS